MSSLTLSAVVFGLVALDVERRRDDLPLLLGERARLVLLPPPPPPPPPPRLRLRLAEVLIERPDFDEVDVARRDLRALHRVVVGAFA